MTEVDGRRLVEAVFACDVDSTKHEADKTLTKSFKRKGRRCPGGGGTAHLGTPYLGTS